MTKTKVIENYNTDLVTDDRNNHDRNNHDINNIYSYILRKNILFYNEFIIICFFFRFYLTYI